MRTSLVAATVLVSFAWVIPPSPAIAQNAIHYGAACGTELWAKKTLMLPGDDRLPTTALPTTIQKLVSLPAPHDPDAIATRRIPGVENILWRLTRVRLIGYRIEADSDFHLILRDDQGRSLVAEIPAPFCTSSKMKNLFAAARSAVERIGGHPASARWWWTDYRGEQLYISITGYGFFDFEHGVNGASANDIELHPVVSVQISK
jgi:hypothetical protein